MDGVFITGTDTLAGKTVVSAGILKLVSRTRQAAYWKPVQTGMEQDDDLSTVKALTELPSDFYYPTSYSYTDPVAPSVAAEREGRPIELRALTERYLQFRERGRFMVVEGVGGLLVPLGQDLVVRDLVKAFEIPTLIVASNKLGAINHTLLTIEACQIVGIPILGVLLSRSADVGRLNNARCISHFGGVEILGELAEADPKHVVSAMNQETKLRSLFE